MEGCRRYLYSEYPKTSLKVLKYNKLDPVLEEQEEEEEPNPEKSRRKNGISTRIRRENLTLTPILHVVTPVRSCTPGVNPVLHPAGRNP